MSPDIGGGAVEPVVDHLGDFGTACKRAVKYVVVDASLREQVGECRAVASFDGIAEGARQGGGVSPGYAISATAAMIRAISCGRDRR